LVGVVVESTYNWYWLVEVLQAAGHRVHLANPASNEQYKGSKYTDDRHDARWLVKLLREQMRLVQMRQGLMVRMRTMLAQQSVASASAQAMRRAPAGSWARGSVDLNVGAVLESYAAVVRSLSEQIEALEQTVLS
jgi:transposase